MGPAFLGLGLARLVCCVTAAESGVLPASSSLELVVLTSCREEKSSLKTGHKSFSEVYTFIIHGTISIVIYESHRFREQCNPQSKSRTIPLLINNYDMFFSLSTYRDSFT